MRTLAISIIFFMLPMTAYESYKAFIVGICDPKFGCSGAFELAILISAAFCVISMLSMVAVRLMSKANMLKSPFLLVTILLGSTHWYILRMEFLQSTSITVFFWLIISVFAYSLAILVSKNITKKTIERSNAAPML